jgi:hypothetical protein
MSIVHIASKEKFVLRYTVTSSDFMDNYLLITDDFDNCLKLIRLNDDPSFEEIFSLDIDHGSRIKDFIQAPEGLVAIVMMPGSCLLRVQCDGS